MLKGEWWKEHGINAKEARRLESALCTIVDNNGPLRTALLAQQASNIERSLWNICDAIRYLVDGWEKG